LDEVQRQYDAEQEQEQEQEQGLGQREEAARQGQEELLRDSVRRKALSSKQMLRRQREQQQRHSERVARAAGMRREKEQEREAVESREGASRKASKGATGPGSVGGGSTEKGRGKEKGRGARRRASAVYATGVDIPSAPVPTAGVTKTGAGFKARAKGGCAKAGGGGGEDEGGDVEGNASLASEGTWSGAPRGRLSTILGSEESQSQSGSVNGGQGQGQGQGQGEEKEGGPDDGIDALSSVFGGSAGSAGDDGQSLQAGAGVYVHGDGDSGSGSGSGSRASSSLLPLANFSESVVRESALSEGLMRGNGVYGRVSEASSTAAPEEFTLRSAARGGVGARASQVARSRSPLRKKDNRDDATTAATATTASKQPPRAKTGRKAPRPSTTGAAAAKVARAPGRSPPDSRDVIGSEERVRAGMRVSEREVWKEQKASDEDEYGYGYEHGEAEGSSEDQRAAKRLASAWRDARTQQSQPGYQRKHRPPRPLSAHATASSSASSSHRGNSSGYFSHEPPAEVVHDEDGYGLGALDSYAYLNEEAPSSQWDAATFNAFTRPSSSSSSSSSNNNNNNKRASSVSGSSRPRRGGRKHTERESDYVKASNNLLNSMLSDLRY
jgi:hypothetical protein